MRTIDADALLYELTSEIRLSMGEFKHGLDMARLYVMKAPTIQPDAPRVMTLEEVRLLCKDDIVWYEHKGVFRQPRPRVVEFVFDEHITFTDGGIWSFSADGYGERWRLWTSRPADEQREATQWL